MVFGKSFDILDGGLPLYEELGLLARVGFCCCAACVEAITALSKDSLYPRLLVMVSGSDGSGSTSSNSSSSSSISLSKSSTWLIFRCETGLATGFFVTVLTVMLSSGPQ